MRARRPAKAADAVDLVEVGPRDGFQSVAGFIPTADKISLIHRLAAAGFPRMEVGSFVSPRALPQMADIGAILRSIRDPFPEVSVLVPNVKGAELAAAAGVRNLVYVVSASEAHNRVNVGRPVADSLGDLAILARDYGALGRFRFNLATAFHCPFEGVTPGDRLDAIVEQVADVLPSAEICLCDTTGRATPRAVGEAFARQKARHAGTVFAYHGHDTYGYGLASLWAAFEQGVRIFDVSVAGLGGCPFAPGATGNVASEDVAYMFEASGIGTGLSLPMLIGAAAEVASRRYGVVGGHVRDVSARRARLSGEQPLARDTVLNG